MNSVVEYVNPLLFSVVIPGRVAVKKNSKRIIRTNAGRPALISSARYQAWERLAHVWVAKAMLSSTSLEISGPVSVHLLFNFKSRLHEADIDNCIGGPLDLLQKAGVIANDKQVLKVTAEKRFGFQESVTIQIFKFESNCAAIAGPLTGSHVASDMLTNAAGVEQKTGGQHG